MLIDSAHWRMVVNGLEKQLQEKTEELDNIKRYLNSNEGTLVQLQNELLKCPVSGEVTVKLKGNYHTFFKKKISHPDGTEDNQKDCSDDSLLKIKNDAVREATAEIRCYIAQQKSENETLHRKVNDLVHKLSQAHRECNELKKDMEDLQKKNSELIEQLKNRAILNSVLARKYEKLQITLKSDVGEAFECELDGKPFEKGYYLRISKEAYDLSKDARIYAHVTLMKSSDK